MYPRRVVITGMGVICALGNNVAETWESLKNGASGIRPIASVNTVNLRFKNGAEVKDFLAADHFPGSQADFLDRFAQFAVVAAREAVADAGQNSVQSERTGILLGSCVGGQAAQDAGFVDLYRENRGRVHPLTIPKTMANAAASQVALEFGIHGPTMTVSTACSSANHAIGQAFWWIRSGLVDTAITGGSEAPFSPGILKAWEAMRVVSPDTCRPFSKDRSGMVLGEGAGVLVLETLESAQARGARIHAEIVGCGMSADAHHLTQPSVAGPALAMRNALADAAIPASAVVYINAHGTGTLANDPTEAAAIREVFGPHAADVLVSSTKSMHGHVLGAAGALEAIATALALRKGFVPPTANFTSLDPECEGIHVVANRAQAADIEYALSNSFAFGGLNGVLAFRRYA